MNPADFLCRPRDDGAVGQCFDVLDRVGPVYNGKRHFSYNAATLIAHGVKADVGTVYIVRSELSRGRFRRAT